MEFGERLYTLDMPVAGIEELLDWDMGIGLDHPDYVDVVLSAKVPDPFDFNSSLKLADNVDNLRVGQVDAPTTFVWDLENNENHEDLDDVFEENIQGGIAADEGDIFFTGDHPQVDYRHLQNIEKMITLLTLFLLIHKKTGKGW